MMSRRLFQSLERLIGTSSGYNTVWHGYARVDENSFADHSEPWQGAPRQRKPYLLIQSLVDPENWLFFLTFLLPCQ